MHMHIRVNKAVSFKQKLKMIMIISHSVRTDFQNKNILKVCTERMNSQN